MKAVVGLFDDFEDAERAIIELTNRKFRRSSISIMTGDSTMKTYLESRLSKKPGPVVRGAAIGAVAGTVLGLVLAVFVGLGIILTPFFVPFILRGMVVESLGIISLMMGIGAALLALLGFFIGRRIPRRTAHIYAEGIKRGMVLIGVEARGDRAIEALNIMRRSNRAGEEKRNHDQQATRDTTRFAEVTISDDRQPKLPDHEHKEGT
jgi:hypothetical protein